RFISSRLESRFTSFAGGLLSVEVAMKAVSIASCTTSGLSESYQRLERAVEARSATSPGDRNLRVSQLDSCKKIMGTKVRLSTQFAPERDWATRRFELTMHPSATACARRSLRGIVFATKARPKPAARRGDGGSGCNL